MESLEKLLLSLPIALLLSHPHTLLQCLQKLNHLPPPAYVTHNNLKNFFKSIGLPTGDDVPCPSNRCFSSADSSCAAESNADELLFSGRFKEEISEVNGERRKKEELLSNLEGTSIGREGDSFYCRERNEVLQTLPFLRTPLMTSKDDGKGVMGTYFANPSLSTQKRNDISTEACETGWLSGSKVLKF